MNKALFLDRDGTINVDKKYVYRIEDFEFLPHIFKICQKAQDNGYLIIVITNQSGVERGFYTIEDLHRCNQYMINEFYKRGIKITDIYYCTSLNDSNYNRKPNPGMFLQAKNKYNIDMSLSLSIGDKIRDLKAAEKAGVKHNFLINNIDCLYKYL